MLLVFACAMIYFTFMFWPQKQDYIVGFGMHLAHMVLHVKTFLFCCLSSFLISGLP